MEICKIFEPFRGIYVLTLEYSVKNGCCFERMLENEDRKDVAHINYHFGYFDYCRIADTGM